MLCICMFQDLLSFCKTDYIMTDKYRFEEDTDRVSSIRRFLSDLTSIRALLTDKYRVLLR